MSATVESKPVFVRMLTMIANVDRSSLNVGDIVPLSEEVALAWIDAEYAVEVTKADYEKAIKSRVETRG